MRTFIKVIAAVAVLLIGFTSVKAMGEGPEIEHAPKVERGVPLTIKVKVPEKGCIVVFVDGLLQDMEESSGGEIRLKIMTNRLEGGFHNVTLRFSRECEVNGEVVYAGKFYVEERKEPFLQFKPGEITSVMLLLVTTLLIILAPGRLQESSSNV